MTSKEKYQIVKKLTELSSKRGSRMMLILLCAVPAFFLPGYFKWFAIVLAFGAQLAAMGFKEFIYEPLMLKDQILQEILFSLAKKTEIQYTLVLRPHAPSAFSFSDEKEAGTGSGLSRVPHPLSQPYSPYEHGYDVFERLERETKGIFVFIALGDLHHAYSRIGLHRTIFLNSNLEQWEQTIDVLIKNAAKIIYVPDISNGMQQELSFILDGKHLERTVFLLPASTNPNSSIENQNAAWKRISKEFYRIGITMPESYDPKANVYMAVNNNELVGVDILTFLKKEAVGTEGILKEVINSLLDSGFINEKHFEGLYEHELCRRFTDQQQKAIQ